MYTGAVYTLLVTVLASKVPVHTVRSSWWPLGSARLSLHSIVIVIGFEGRECECVLACLLLSRIRHASYIRLLFLRSRMLLNEPPRQATSRCPTDSLSHYRRRCARHLSGLNEHVLAAVGRHIL
ncbi:hypothetical protein F5X97DRAFT_294261 [Nemania serpens]|nr:hypothetical protein F5X97DRAFT_294261 [Nemania serpens]